MPQDDDTIGVKYLLIDTGTGEQIQPSNYEPLIHSKINGVKEVFKPIKNDRDLNEEMSRI